MAYKQERMLMQNQRPYLNRPKGGVPNMVLLFLYVTFLVIPLFCMSCQPNRHAAPTNKYVSSSQTKKLYSEAPIRIDHVIQKNDTTHLPQTTKITILKGDRKIHTILHKFDWYETGIPTVGQDSIGKIDFVDVDFDGNKDILVYKGGFGNQGADMFDCYLWNDDANQFRITPSFSRILNPAIDNKKKCIYSFSRENADCYVHEKYEFQNGEFRIVSTLTEKAIDNKMQYVLETRKDDGLRKKILHTNDLGEWKERIMKK